MDTGTRALLAHRLEAARIPLSSPGWGLLASGPDVRSVQVYDLDPSRIPQQQRRTPAVPPPW